MVILSLIFGIIKFIIKEFFDIIIFIINIPKAIYLIFKWQSIKKQQQNLPKPPVYKSKFQKSIEDIQNSKANKNG